MHGIHPRPKQLKDIGLACIHLLEHVGVHTCGTRCGCEDDSQKGAHGDHQRQSSATIRGNHAPARGAISGNQWQSRTCSRGNQWQSVAISGNHAPAREHVCIARRSRNPHHAAGPRPLRPRLGKSPPPPPRASDAPSWAPQSGTLKHNQAHSVALRRTLRRTLIRVIYD